MDTTESRSSASRNEPPAKASLFLNNRWTAAQVLIAATAALAVTSVFADRRSPLDLIGSFLGCIGVLIVSSWILATIPYGIMRITRSQTPKLTFSLLSAVICAFCASLLIAGSVSKVIRGNQPAPSAAARGEAGR